MQNLFAFDSPIVEFFNKLANYMILSFLWLVFCIPVVTIGAATTAMYSVQLRLIQDKDDAIIKHFLKRFRKDFRKSTVLFLITLPILAVLAYNLVAILGLIPGCSDSFRLMLLILECFALVILQYIFPLTAKYENTIGHTIKNAAVLGMCYFFPSAVALLISAVPIIIQFIPFVSDKIKDPVIWMLIGTIVLENVRMRILDSVFKKVVPEENSSEADKERKIADN